MKTPRPEVKEDLSLCDVSGVDERAPEARAGAVRGPVASCTAGKARVVRAAASGAPAPPLSGTRRRKDVLVKGAAVAGTPEAHPSPGNGG